MTAPSKKAICVFCGNHNARLLFANRFHPFKKEHGPFDIYQCNYCNSLITFPLPSKNQQAELYREFEDGLIPRIRSMREENSLYTWYEQCICRATRTLAPHRQKNFTWVDIGAGGGELAKQMAEKFPASKGWAIDFHEQPRKLKHITNIEWLQCDLNDKEFRKNLQHIRADVVMSITVLEHVLHPDMFLKNGIRLIKPQGVFYITAPCSHTKASRLLGSKWPYLIPGEHLNLPSVKGLCLLLQRLQKEIAGVREVRVKETILPYMLGYYLSFFKVKFLKAILPDKLPVKLPTGIVEAIIKLD